jgi:hypothetical protein
MTRRCRYCAKPIPKRTQTTFFGSSQKTSSSKWWSYREEMPCNKDEAQALLDQPIVSVKWFRTEPPKDGYVRGSYDPGFDYISQVTTWDGESYADKYFCKGFCAQNLGYMAARQNLATDDYNNAVERDNKRERS